MRQEQNKDRKHLTARQIVNRYRKGEYVDESIEDISSAIALSGKTFNNIAIPFPTNILEQVCKNISIAKTLYERQKAGKSTEDIIIPDYPQLKDLLTDLSYPTIWESIQKKEKDYPYSKILYDRGIMNKYHLDVKGQSNYKIFSVLSTEYKNNVEQAGLPYFNFKLVLLLLII